MKTSIWTTCVAFAAIGLAACGGEAAAPEGPAPHAEPALASAVPAASTERPAGFPENVFLPDGLTIVSAAPLPPSGYFVQAAGPGTIVSFVQSIQGAMPGLGWTETEHYDAPDQGNARLKYASDDRIASYTLTDARDRSIGFSITTGPKS